VAGERFTWGRKGSADFDGERKEGPRYEKQGEWLTRNFRFDEKRKNPNAAARSKKQKIRPCIDGGRGNILGHVREETPTKGK